MDLISLHHPSTGFIKSINSLSSCRLLIDSGTPVSWFCPVKLPRDSGIEPDNRFADRSRSFSLVRSPSSPGIGPDKLFSKGVARLVRKKLQTQLG